jgi:uncharacterized protein YybS (DUF2232 family)
MKKIILLMACLLLAISISEMVRWFIITAKDLSFDAMKSEYSAVLPDLLKNELLHTLLLILCSAGSAFLFLQLKNEKGLIWVAKIGAILGFALAFWQVFSLM